MENNVEVVVKTIFERLAVVQKILKAPKDKDNSFGKYKYRSCEDILESVKPILKENGLVLFLNDEIVEICGRFYVKATATVYTTDGTPYAAEEYSVSAYARESESKSGMDAAQITGAASSYARKYALNGLFCIDDTKDADTDEYTQESQARAKKTATKKKTEQPAVVSSTVPDGLPEEIATESAPICEDCGEVIKPTDKYTVEKIVESTKKSFGVVCCMKCGALRLARIKADKEKNGG